MEDHYSEEYIMNNTKSVAFLYFPKNYTKGLITYFDDTNNYDIQSEAYVHFTKDSE